MPWRIEFADSLSCEQGIQVVESTLAADIIIKIISRAPRKSSLDGLEGERYIMYKSDERIQSIEFARRIKGKVAHMLNAVT